jgi:hypothetical protein
MVIVRSPMLAHLVATGIKDGQLTMDPVDSTFVEQTQAAGFSPTPGRPHLQAVLVACESATAQARSARCSHTLCPTQADLWVA